MIALPTRGDDRPSVGALAAARATLTGLRGAVAGGAGGAAGTVSERCQQEKATATVIEQAEVLSEAWAAA